MDTRLREYATLEEYVKMCDEGKEIQDIRKKRKLKFKGQEIWERGDYVANIKLKRVSIRGTHGEVSPKLCWLPTQFQLQAMVRGTKYRESNYLLIKDFKLFFVQLENHESMSMEQLWFAFVMKAKFNKAWDSEDKKWRADVH